MKKIYTFVILFCCLNLVSKAQFEQGQKVLGGGVGFSTSKNETPYYNSSNNTYNSTSSNVYINPTFGKFSKPNVLCGIGLSYGYIDQKNFNVYPNMQQVSTTYSNTLGINVFSQRFFSLTSNLFFTVNTGAEASYNFGTTSNAGPYNTQEAKVKGFGVAVNVAPGLTYKLTKRLLFDAYLSNLVNVGYAHSESKYKNTPGSAEVKTDQNSFNLSSSLSNNSLGNVGLGFRLLLRKK